MKTIDLRKYRDCRYLYQRLTVLDRESRGCAWMRSSFGVFFNPTLVTANLPVYQGKYVKRPRLTESVLASVIVSPFVDQLVRKSGFAINHDGRSPGTFGASLPTPGGLVVRRHARVQIACALVLLEASGIRVKL